MLENPRSAVGNPTSALGPSGSSFGPSSLAPVGIHYLLLSNFTSVYIYIYTNTLLNCRRDRLARINCAGRADRPCLLVGNKADLDSESRAVEFELAARWSHLWNIGYIETSAKTRTNVDKVIIYLLISFILLFTYLFTPWTCSYPQSYSYSVLTIL